MSPQGPKKFTEPVALSSSEPGDFPLPRTVSRLGLDLLALRARCKGHGTDGDAGAQERRGARSTLFARTSACAARTGASCCMLYRGRTRDSPARWRFRPPCRLTFRFRVHARRLGFDLLALRGRRRGKASGRDTALQDTGAPKIPLFAGAELSTFPRAFQLPGEKSVDDASRSTSSSRTRPSGRRSWASESRSRTVTVSSSTVCPSIVIVQGVPISSWRR